MLHIKNALRPYSEKTSRSAARPLTTPSLHNTASTSPPPSKNPGDALANQRLDDNAQLFITQVFSTMRSIYGHLWQSLHKNDAARQAAKWVWFNAFNDAGLTADQVKAALTYCKTEVPDMPNLPKLIAIARSLRGTPAMRRAALPPPSPTGPALEASRAAARAELAKMQSLFTPTRGTAHDE